MKRILSPFSIFALFALLLALYYGVTTTLAQEPESTPTPEEETSEDSAGGGRVVIFLPIIFKSLDATDFSEAARKLVAERKGIPISELMVVYSVTASYPLQSITASALKVMDKRDGMIYGVMLDKNGQELDAAKLATDEHTAYVAKYGKLDLALAEHLVSTPEDVPIEVTIWLKEPPYSGPDRPEPIVDSETLTAEERLAVEKQLNAFFAQVDAQRAAAVKPVVAPVVERLARLGYVAKADKYVPVLSAHLSPKMIRQVARWNEVNRVYLSQIYQPALEVARSTIHADIVNDRNINGTGVKVAQIEVGRWVDGILKGVRVAPLNPYLSGVIQDEAFTCSLPDGHETGVAGIIRSTHTMVRGTAPSVSLWAGGSCIGTDIQIQAAADRAVTWGARVLNLSIGRDTNPTGPPTVDDSLARFFDDMVLNRARLVVAATGNLGSSGCPDGSNGNVLSPGVAYNLIAVGNFDDKNTIYWAGDDMNSCSSWRNPTSFYNDHEKPEVVAPGTNINSTTLEEPWIGNFGSGTSAAAPMVTGVAALLLQRNPSLAIWPEAVKAILMATAVHNIVDGVNFWDCPPQSPLTPSDCRDGAGGIVADQADDVVRGAKGNWGGDYYDCNAPNILDVEMMDLTAGMLTRVAIAWDNNPNWEFYQDLPGADLDLEVVCFCQLKPAPLFKRK